MTLSKRRLGVRRKGLSVAGGHRHEQRGRIEVSVARGVRRRRRRRRRTTRVRRVRRATRVRRGARGRAQLEHTECTSRPCRRQACASRHKSAQSSGGDGTGSTRANGDQRRACNPICAWPICFDVCSSRLLVARPVDARGLMQALLALARARASLHAGRKPRHPCCTRRPALRRLAAADWLPA